MKPQTALLLALLVPLTFGCRTASGACEGEAQAPAAAPAPAAVDIMSDFNGNGIEDAYEIATGSLLDENLNGIPDEAEAMFMDADEQDAPRR